MPDITTQIKMAISNEPPLGFEPADVITAARRVRRRRGMYAATAGVAAAVAIGTVLALPGGTASTPAGSGGSAGKLSLTALSRIAGQQSASVPSVQSTAPVDGVTAAEAFALFEKDTSMNVTAAQASVLRPPGELDLTAGLAVPGHPYLNIQVAPKKTMSTAMPTCAELSGLASGSGDGYYGPCTINRLPDGSILVVRSGTTRQGHFTMAQATLIRPDGSSVFAEDTNQAWHKTGAKGKPSALPPVVTVNPPVSANTLATFIRDVAARA